MKNIRNKLRGIIKSCDTARKRMDEARGRLRCEKCNTSNEAALIGLVEANSALFTVKYDAMDALNMIDRLGWDLSVNQALEALNEWVKQARALPMSQFNHHEWLSVNTEEVPTWNAWVVSHTRYIPPPRVVLDDMVVLVVSSDEAVHDASSPDSPDPERCTVLTLSVTPEGHVMASSKAGLGVRLTAVNDPRLMRVLSDSTLS